MGIELVRLDFDFLACEAERQGSLGECPCCDFDTGIRLLCPYCGVCFSCHSDYFHDYPDPEPHP